MADGKPGHTGSADLEAVDERASLEHSTIARENNISIIISRGMFGFGFCVLKSPIRAGASHASAIYRFP